MNCWLKKGEINSFFVFEFYTTGFNILKNLPLWCLGFLLILDKKQTQYLKYIFLFSPNI